MQTQLADFIRDTPQGQESGAILRSCVHCGFCTATCPTYQLLGDELDGPRGRIYLLKQLLEGAQVTRTTQRHLDRCLTCLNCETTCPSGVRYGRLLDIGREIIEHRVARPLNERLVRWGLQLVLPHESRFRTLLRLGRLVRPLLPGVLRRLVPAARPGDPRWPAVQTGERRMALLRGCVQPALAPQINAAAARVMQRLGVRLQEAPRAVCCGALHHHLSAGEKALQQMRTNVDVWTNMLDDGVEALVVTASGCGATIKQYGELLAHDAHYRTKAARVAAHTMDLAEVLTDGDLPALRRVGDAPRIACHVPCTLQHAQRLPTRVQDILSTLGFVLTATPDQHMCCGSAGTYSVLQSDISQRLLSRKLQALTHAQPACIATANIGCLQHLQAGTELPVRHWIELVDEYCPTET
ncbi:MAG: glycolate oxidase subunit GlcF [Gammaproteobacteria bacterium]|nr:glycolate oxidase subunit GlcF [Gammaproteobacteria bacterium]